MAKEAKKPGVKIKQAVAKKTATKKVQARKTPVKKAAAKKSLTKKLAVDKVAAKKTSARKSAKTSIAAQPVGGFPEQMRDAAMKVLDERKAEDIVLIPLAGRSSLADYVIIASGRASRQVAALADYLREAFFKLGARQVRVEGKAEANWVLVDAGDVIVHLFRPEVRSYYDMDTIWATKPPRS